MTRRPRAHQIEDLSRDRIRHAFNSVGWTVEDLRKDYGEDLLVRIFEDGVATPLVLFVQCKGTDNAKRYRLSGNGDILFPVKRRHIEHWDRFWEPVILSVWDSKTDRSYWECVQTYLSTHQGKIALSAADDAGAEVLNVPVANTFEEDGLDRIKSIAINRFERFELEKNGAQVLVGMLEKALSVKIDYNPKAGIIWVDHPDGSVIVHTFGQANEILHDLARYIGCPPEEAANEGIRIFREMFVNSPPKTRDALLRAWRRAAALEERGEEYRGSFLKLVIEELESLEKGPAL